MLTEKAIQLCVHVENGVAIVMRTDQQNPRTVSGLECHDNAEFVTDVLDTHMVDW